MGVIAIHVIRRYVLVQSNGLVTPISFCSHALSTSIAVAVLFLLFVVGVSTKAVNKPPAAKLCVFIAVDTDTA